MPFVILLCLVLILAVQANAVEPVSEAENTQVESTKLTTPAEALASIRVPDGFKVSLFAAEPDVRQPIALTTDHRGRLWIAENYTYSERPLFFDTRLRDRIVILEDSDHDGTSDRRTVFWDDAQQLTSVEIGCGGVWAMCPPQLLFLPDADGDDRPDGPPVVMLDGFDVGAANRHNFANGLKWGPDGWLYGRNGISNVGQVGPLGASPNERVEIGPGIWRFHPETKQVEAVCTGTTNPWGHDWNDYGELFFINTVIGHLWHAVPGAHFKRMFGADSNPNVYELLDQTADHFHWDTAEAWQDVRKGLSKSSADLGGGHAHSGMMIYLGDNWPESYRGQMFTINMHGSRLNRDRLERHSASYVGRHETDFLFSSDPWFRGIELIYGPDGGVYLADWSDIGECHETDGVHRTTGRIFKVTFGSPLNQSTVDLKRLGSNELVELQLHRNDWFVRQARRLLHERAVAGTEMADSNGKLIRMFGENREPTRRLRALWCLNATRGINQEWLLKQLADRDEHVRAWVVRLLVDQGDASAEVARALSQQAAVDDSGLVLLYLASALQRILPEHRWTLAANLSSRTEFAADRVLPSIIWYGVESAVPSYIDRAADLASSATMPIVRRNVARRITQELDVQPNGLRRLVEIVGEAHEVDRRRDLLAGIGLALRGRRKVDAPSNWNEVYERLAGSTDDEVRRLARELAVVFGDGRALSELKQVATSSMYDLPTRRAAIQTLVDARADGLQPLLLGLLMDHDIAAYAIHGLASVNSPSVAELLIEKFSGLYPPGREAAMVSLTARPAAALSLLQAIADGKVDRSNVTAFQIRQMQGYPDATTQELLRKLWPELRPISADKKARIQELKAQLSVEAIRQADARAGRVVWERACAKCHVMFGAGTNIGPDLTGSQRSNLDYLLENIVDPSATLAANFRMTTIVLLDGRVIQGVVLNRTEQTWEAQTSTERVVILAADIAESRESELSLMPEGLLDVLTEDQVRSLFAYLMSPRQVPLEESLGRPIRP